MNPRNFKNHRWLWLVCTAAYLAVLGLLTLAEHRAPDASIRTFGDALWYSLVTISTVGYGDLYPVTVPGKLLGVVFILLSLGLLAFLIGYLIQMLTVKILPALQLRLARGKNWYIFSCQNDAAFSLAGNLAEQEPDCVLLFPRRPDCVPPEQLRYLLYSGAPETVAAGKKDRCSICFMEDTDTYEQAVAALSAGHPVFCRTGFAPDFCPENLTLFNPYDCCAQRYWQDHGLQPDENILILIGDGRCAEQLLTQGLLLNVYPPERTVTYHVFGNWENYLRNHHRLAETLCMDGETPGMDRLHFHRAPWNGDSALLATARRIILCHDDRDANLEILGQLNRYFPVTGQIHLLGHRAIPGLTVFGSPDTIYTPQLVLQQQLNRAAKSLHRIYRDASDGNAPDWQQLTEFQRQSNIAAAGHLLTKIRILLEDDTIRTITPEHCRAAYARYRGFTPEEKEVCCRIEHQRWMRFYSMNNWRYGPLRNNAAREHPMIRPYEALPPDDQAKDDQAWELLEQLAQQLPG